MPRLINALQWKAGAAVDMNSFTDSNTKQNETLPGYRRVVSQALLSCRIGPQ